jgi:hypothetical protein
MTRLRSVEDAATQLREYGNAGVERVMLQHLDHQDTAIVEGLGRALGRQGA